MESSFYLEFENNFRGSRDQVTNLFSNYDGIIQYILDRDPEPTLLDIGSGRGEWLQKCSERGFKSCGIELNPEMASLCQNLGLDIIQGDAINSLTDIAENTFSIITAFHIIEHMSFDSMNKILIECQRILKKDGLLILETPSIDNLSISSRLFYIDPTHINPINADLLSFTLNKIGYNMVKVFYINGGPLQEEDKYSLTRILNGVAQDLLLIATKSEKTSLQLDENKDWEKTLKLGLTTIDACVQFDHQLRKKLLENEETINHLRSRIYSLEKHITAIFNSPLYQLSNFSIGQIQKIILIVDKFKILIKRIIYKFITYLLGFTYRILNIILRKNPEFFYLICRLMDRILRVYGFRMKSGKLFRSSRIARENEKLISLNQQKLDKNYNLSINSKKIYKEIT